jgi:hypothetical protein
VVAVGRGPTSVTVTAPDVSVPFKVPVTIKGTVNDISPGTTQDAIALRFPNGVAAVSDASQDEWMRYVYNQFPRPMNASGVEVILSVIDSNGNMYDIGTTTSDSSGMFSFVWTPEISGKYTVIATFAGSKAYWPSYAQTAMNVLEESAATPTDTTQVQLPPFELYLALATVAIIVAIAIVGLLLLKKKA